MSENKEWTELVEEKELAGTDPGEMIALEIETEEGDEIPLVLARVPNEEYGWLAFENHCPHDGGTLDEGHTDLDHCSVFCPRHGAAFDMKTGRVLQMPAATDIRNFPLKIEQGKVFVKL